MSEDKVGWTRDLIEKLQKNGIGDLQRFDYIRSYLEKDGKLNDNDREYLKEKYKELQQLEESDNKSKTTEEADEDDDSVNKMQDEIKDLKEKLGKMQEEQKTTKIIQTQGKSEGTTVTLSLVLGLIGFPGIGHIYVGHGGKGVAILVPSLILFYWGISIINDTDSYFLPTFGWFLLFIYFIIFIWQIFYARNLCRKYNERLRAPKVERESYA